MLILMRKDNEQDQAHIFQDTYFESFQIHQLTVVYHFEHIMHDNLLNFLFQMTLKIFFCS